VNRGWDGAADLVGECGDDVGSHFDDDLDVNHDVTPGDARRWLRIPRQCRRCGGVLDAWGATSAEGEADVRDFLCGEADDGVDHLAVTRVRPWSVVIIP
jgi:hypothetical protein